MNRTRVATTALVVAGVVTIAPLAPVGAHAGADLRVSERHATAVATAAAFARTGNTPAYCAALQFALDASTEALGRQGHARAIARTATAAAYFTAAHYAPSLVTERAMLAAGATYTAMVLGDARGAQLASTARFAAVPAAAPATQRACGIDLFEPPDYQFVVKVATT